MRSVRFANRTRSRRRPRPSIWGVRGSGLVFGWLPAHWSIPGSTRLIHSDYNLKNILIRKGGSVWTVAGVLDWEFAMAGSPLADIGNFLRFEDELPPGFSESFIKGYLSNSIGLPGNRREVARLLDLAAMVNFLGSEEETPRSFRTAVSVIAKTVGA